MISLQVGILNLLPLAPLDGGHLAILALGFVSPETDTIVAQYGCDLDERGNVKVGPDWMSSIAHQVEPDPCTHPKA